MERIERIKTRSGFTRISTRIDADSSIRVNPRSHPRLSASIGFTLLELLISIAISVLIAAAVYFSLNTALESWEYTKDQLALQKVLNETAERITGGSVAAFGLKDSLEILAAGRDRIEFVPPWTDDTHTVTEAGFVYTLDARMKPGTGIPITEVKLFEQDTYEFMLAELIREEETMRTKVRLRQAAPRASQLRFTYHPDPKSNYEVIKHVWWDDGEMEIFSEYKGETSSISANPFDVKITKMELKFFDRANNLISESDSLSEGELGLITGIEIFIEAELKGYKSALLSFVSLRNAPMWSGYLPLSDRLRIPIPDSYDIHTLLLKNIDGVSNEDVLELVADPESGKSWSVKVIFSRAGGQDAKIDRYVIEYPPGNELFTEYPRTGVGVGLNLLTLGANGRYDYDYDGEDYEDMVLLEGDVYLKVEKMDVEGCGLFVRP